MNSIVTHLPASGHQHPMAPAHAPESGRGCCISLVEDILILKDILQEARDKSGGPARPPPRAKAIGRSLPRLCGGVFRIGPEGATIGIICFQLLISFSSTYLVMGPATPLSMGFAKMPTIVPTAFGAKPAKPSTVDAILPSSACVPFAISALSS